MFINDWNVMDQYTGKQLIYFTSRVWSEYKYLEGHDQEYPVGKKKRGEAEA